MDKLQPLINESAQLMLIGMGTVFIILIMLIFLINVVSKLVITFKLEDEPATTARAAYTVSKKITATNDNELIAVISSAISTYKKQHSTS
ncbi:MAG: OadG family protein [Gammaproteobacteria bacterium]|jgi:oxaloacetate decarboxylase gamma subunit|nr:OadG family protein [Gammaproteobacteria bacterium]MBT3725192.1 OadG family protein [Gammaproteobacteria bacterium]MBT4076973.1 OadG family protein [Gammaproteobacteria bacterium]MBT4196120.1 OadG family protein [Gammaproteobacteria bacterium]MBT4450488.1 OadG family protein [Gammaproteobacteria bacterium]